MIKNITIVKHPFIADSLSHLRDKTSELPTFRRHSDRLCQLLFTEAIKGLDLKESEIETPIQKTKGQFLEDEVIVIPILRAGLAMMFGAIQLLPKSKIGIVGFQRDETTAIASEYYWKVPKINSNSVVIVTDPMLATGGTAHHVLTKLYKSKFKKLKYVCVVAAPEGIEKLTKDFPDLEIYCAAVDETLNAQKYIVPGLGDYGDRYFGTE